MKIQIDELTFNLTVSQNQNKNSIPIVMLHGFGGNRKDWDSIREKLNEHFNTIAVDLIGHGESSSPPDLKYYSAQSIIEQLNRLFANLKLEKFILLGYSMGGRAALSYAVNLPEKISALILESTSPGISNQLENEQRLRTDMLLSKKIEENGLLSFFRDWYDQPFFESLKNNPSIDWGELIQKRINNSPIGLKNIIYEFSPGKMPDYWGELEKFDFPVLLINGELDKKYDAINKKAVKLLKYGTHDIIENVGHNTHLEKPSDFIKFVESFLQKN